MNKEKRKAYMKVYREINKDKIKAQRDANKEEKKACNKVYYQTNKEVLKVLRDANKEEKKAYNKDYNEANKDGLYTVYYLPEEHYAGMTTILGHRLAKHKSEYNRHIEDVEIIGKYKTKAEATRVEATLHAMGYLGKHPYAKKLTLKQLL